MIKPAEFNLEQIGIRGINPDESFSTAQDQTYPFRDRRLPYRSESLSVSDAERALICSWTTADEKAGPNPSLAPNWTLLGDRRKIIIDTDIGTDIDDALALLMLLHFPGEAFDLLGVTTVYGHVPIRTRIAEMILAAWARERNANPPKVHKGESVPLGTHRPVWHTGTEGFGILPLDEIDRLRALTPKDTVCFDPEATATDAPRWIVEETRRHPGEITLVALGALTNIAMALRLDPNLPKRVPRIVVMGMGGRLRQCQDPNLPFSRRDQPITPGLGTPWFHYPNHNLCADTLASVEVFTSGIPIDVVNDTVTTLLWWGRPFDSPSDDSSGSDNACQRLIDAQGPPHCALVGQLLDVWLRYRSALFFREVKGTCPHDALTIAEAVYPGRFLTFTPPGHVLVHQWAAFSTFVSVPGGPHRIAQSVSTDAFLEELSQRLQPNPSSPVQRKRRWWDRWWQSQYEIGLCNSQSGPGISKDPEISKPKLNCAMPTASRLVRRESSKKGRRIPGLPGRILFHN
jgi:purine nucleosidase